MKERRYMDDWVNEVRLDEKTGRDRRVPVYTGVWYTLDAAPGMSAALAVWAPFLVCAGLLALFFLLDDAGTRSLPVFLPAAFALFPLMYWGLGVWTVSRIRGRFTRLQREKGYGRMLRSSLGCVIFLGVAALADLVRMVTAGGPEQDLPGWLALLGAFLAALLAFSRQRRLERHIVETGGEKT